MQRSDLWTAVACIIVVVGIFGLGLRYGWLTDGPRTIKGAHPAEVEITTKPGAALMVPSFHVAVATYDPETRRIRLTEQGRAMGVTCE